MLREAKSDELLFFFRVNTKSARFAQMKRVFYEYMDMRFGHPRIRRFIMHDETQEEGRFLVIKKDARGGSEGLTQPESGSWARVSLNGKSNIRVYSSSINNRDIYQELEQFLRTHANLQNEFNIVSDTDKDFYVQLQLDSNSLSKHQIESFRDEFDGVISRLRTKHAQNPQLSQKLQNSLFFSSFRHKFGKHSEARAAVFCTDLNMRSEFINLIDKNQSRSRLQGYLAKHSFDRLRTTDERKFDLSAQTDYSDLETFIEDFYMSKRAESAHPSIHSETVRHSPKTAFKLTRSSLLHEMTQARSARPMLVLFHDKADPGQLEYLSRFERLARDWLDTPSSPRVDFMRINTSRNSGLAEAHLQSPLVKFVRRQAEYDAPIIARGQADFEDKVRTATKTLGTSRQISQEEFFRKSPLRVAAQIREMRINLV